MEQPTTPATHIVHVITKCDYGGAQSVVRELALEQLRRGHRVTVVSGLLGPVAATLQAAGVDVHLEPSLEHAIRPLHEREALHRLTARLDALRADIVHTHSSKGGLLGRRAARTLGLPVVYTAHGWPFQKGAAARQRVLSFAGEWVSSRAPGPIVCVTTADLRLARHSYVCPPDRLHLVHNGIGDVAVPAPPRPERASGLELLMIARFAPPKRQDLVVGALAALPPDVRVTFAGDGDGLDRVRALAAPYGDRVRFVGVSDPAPLLAAADAVVLASDYEGLSMSVIEAMRAGRPVVANRLPGLRDAIEHQRSGLFADLDAASLAGAIRELLDPATRARLGAEARRDWATRFTAGTMADRYDDVYEHARADAAARSPA